MEKYGMVPDSTQDKRRKKKAEKGSAGSQKKKSKLKEGARRKAKAPSKFMGCPVLPKDEVTLQPIKFYLNDKDVAVRQMFQSVPEQLLFDLMPSVVKAMPMEELHKLCVAELEAMSHDHIMNVLHGTENECSSSAIILADTAAEKQKADVEEPIADSTSGVTLLEDRLRSPSPELPSATKVAHRIHVNPRVFGAAAAAAAAAAGAAAAVAAAQCPPPSLVPASVISQSQLEIIELEARARAIKAMLNKVAPDVSTASAPSTEDGSDERETYAW